MVAPTVSTALKVDKLPDVPAKQSDFQMQLVKNTIDDSLEAFRFSIHRDVQNMHVELLRQFQIQKV
jgi:protein NEDD1